MGGNQLVHGVAAAVAHGGAQQAETFRIGLIEWQHRNALCQQGQHAVVLRPIDGLHFQPCAQFSVSHHRHHDTALRQGLKPP